MGAPVRRVWPALLAVSFALALPAARAAAQAPPVTPAVSVNWHVGDALEVRFLGSWYPAHVVGTYGGRWEIAYDNYPPDWNQLVGAERLRPRQPAPPPAPPAPPPGNPVAHVARLGAGTRVLVEWHGTWYPARVVHVAAANVVRIQYVGYPHSSDEDVGPDRVRMPAKP